jgi:hypothetical protein
MLKELKRWIIWGKISTGNLERRMSEIQKTSGIISLISKLLLQVPQRSRCGKK